jgi:hypothetical protein
MLMNGEFAIEQGRAFGERLLREAGEDEASQIRLAWRTALAREPSDEELSAAQAFLREQVEYYASHPESLQSENKDAAAPAPQVAALANLCQALVSCNEFLYVD